MRDNVGTRTARFLARGRRSYRAYRVARSLHQDTLGHLHILLNCQWTVARCSRSSSSVFPNCAIASPCGAIARSTRGSTTASRLSPLVPDDTAEYLRLRLRQAGCDRELFATDAIGLLHEATYGAMRDLDRLAAAALRETAKKTLQRLGTTLSCEVSSRTF